jgi:hypothetical protein
MIIEHLDIFPLFICKISLSELKKDFTLSSVVVEKIHKRKAKKRQIDRLEISVLFNYLGGSR